MIEGMEYARWAVLWQSENQLDGYRSHLIRDDRDVKLFKSRAQARAYINERYGYIRTRPDLQAEPCGWRMPVPVKVGVGFLFRHPRGWSPGGFSEGVSEVRHPVSKISRHPGNEKREGGCL